MPEDEEDIRSKYKNHEDFSNYICTDEYGFVTEVFQNKPALFTNSKLQWYALLDTLKFGIKKFKLSVKNKHLLEKGIPLSLKHRVWKELIYSKNNILYEEMKLENCKYEYQIHVDVQRTFRYHFLFFKKYGKGQSELFNILIAFANFNKQVGYCQGMSDICAVFLMYFSEKEAFHMFISLIQKNNLNGLFDSNLSKLPEIIKIQNSIFIQAIPSLHRHLSIQKIDFSIYGMGWYMTLFSRFNIKLVLRIWDFLMFYGFNVLVYFAAAILKVNETKILESKGEVLLELVGKINEMDLDEDIVVSIAVGFIDKLNNRSLE